MAQARQRARLIPKIDRAKRSAPVRTRDPSLFELLLQQGKNPLRRFGGIRIALLVEDLHLARIVAVLYENAVLLRLGVRRGTPKRELGEKALVLLSRQRGFGIDVPHEIEAFRSVAVLDGEADAIEHQSHPPPGAVERLGELERADPVVGP